VRVFLDESLSPLMGGTTFCSRKAFGQALRQDTQRICEIERVHAHVEQAGDGLGRELVCSVEKTMWPVSEASPMETVLSRDSPTMMMVGPRKTRA
jgi:hypothetical protein